MVMKTTSVLSCLLPARRLGLATDEKLKHHPDPIPQRVRANTAPADALPPPLIIPNGGIGESPNPALRSLAPQARQKRSSFTTFFAFSSKRRSSQIIHLQQGHLVPPQAVRGRWVPGSGQAQVHIINPSSIPSPLRTDEEEYYYSYYSPLTPTLPSHPASPIPDTSPAKQQRQDLIGNTDIDSPPSSPQLRHPYAHPSPIPHPKTGDALPPLRHATSQPLRHQLQDSRSDIHMGMPHTRMPSSHLGHDTSQRQSSQHQLRTSVSTPNLASGSAPAPARSLLRKKPPTPKRQERWLSAETWWDALFSPSPRFRVQRAPRPHTATDSIAHHPVTTPVLPGPNRNPGVTFPSILPARPRAASVTSPNRPTLPTLLRTRSALDLSNQRYVATPPLASFEPALETLVDEPTPPPDRDTHPPEPLLTLEQVLDEGVAFEQQRAQWKEQAYKSLGNKHIRSFSRARSKSLNERHVRASPRTVESHKAHLNLEFLAARTLLGSQSTMPVVHVTKPSNSSSHSKAYSHSHSQSAHSHTHSSHSRVYSHSHSHSLTTSNSSKSSRNQAQRGHFRNASWGKTALWKAGSLCGLSQDDTDDKVPSSSRGDAQGIIHTGGTNAEGVADIAKDSPSPSGEVGIAISSSPPPESCFDPGPSRNHESDKDSRWSSRHTHKSSEYAGPHPSAIDSNLPQFGGASDISLRHRLPPRAIIHPPIAPITHPYRSVTAQSEPLGNKGSKGAAACDKITEDPEATELTTPCTPYPHISLSHADFERYGVGEALVYASLPRPEKTPETKDVDAQSQSRPLPFLQEQSPLRDTATLQSEGRDSISVAMNSVPSLTGSTFQMVMSAFDDPDELDEFRDLFYKPHSAIGSHYQEAGMPINQVPTDVHSSPSSSPLTHLMRKLSEEVHSLRDPSRSSSDPASIQRSEPSDHQANESVSKFVFTDVARSSSSPPPAGSSSQLHMPIQEGNESTSQAGLVIPEDVSSFYTSSVLDMSMENHENDTFGYSVKHGQLEAVMPAEPVRSPTQQSTHLSIQEDDDDAEEEEDDTAFLSPVTKRYGLVSIDAVRASYLTTTSDISQMSGLSDFPLPPSGARPVSILQAYFEGASPSPVDPTSDGEETRKGHGHRRSRSADGDVEATLRALRMTTTARVTSYMSRRSTFGGSEDMDFITQLHQAGDA